MIYNLGASGKVTAYKVEYNDTTVANELDSINTTVSSINSVVSELGNSDVLTTFTYEETRRLNKPITDYKFIYIELFLSGLSISSRLIPVSRIIYGRRYHVTFNNSIEFYNGAVEFTDANNCECDFLAYADSLQVYGIK